VFPKTLISAKDLKKKRGEEKLSERQGIDREERMGKREGMTERKFFRRRTAKQVREEGRKLVY
jgi:hypothetical protein